MQNAVNQLYGGKLRLRVNGILIENDQILLIKHFGIGEKDYLWAPPGGGVEFGSTIIENLIREYKEETGLIVSVKDFLFVNEVYLSPLHAIELFYRVEQVGGELKLGSDPEMNTDDQLIAEICFFDFNEIKKMNNQNVHNLFAHCNSISELLNMNGYFKY